MFDMFVLTSHLDQYRQWPVSLDLQLGEKTVR